MDRNLEKRMKMDTAVDASPAEGRRHPLVIGHRGAAGEAPENTLASFALALQQGCDAVELDVHTSLDGELIVCHDATVDRTTNGTGAIRDMAAETIRMLDAGSWYSDRFRGERIPLLQEVLELVPANIMVNVEVKRADAGELAAALVQLFRRMGRLDQVVVSSFDHKYMLLLKQSEPNIRIGLLYAAKLVRLTDYVRLLGADVFSLHPHAELVDAYDIRSAASAGWSTYPFTVNSPEGWQALTAAGVSGIITDYPGKLRQYLNGPG